MKAATAESQERWNRYYEEAAEKSGEREHVDRMFQKLESRRFWDRIFMVGSAAGLIALTSFFYTVLTR